MINKLTPDILYKAKEMYKAQGKIDEMIIYCNHEQAKECIDAGLLRVRDDGLLEIAL
jgi:hypothetical protein